MELELVARGDAIYKALHCLVFASFGLADGSYRSDALRCWDRRGSESVHRSRLEQRPNIRRHGDGWIATRLVAVVFLAPGFATRAIRWTQAEASALAMMLVALRRAAADLGGDADADGPCTTSTPPRVRLLADLIMVGGGIRERCEVLVSGGTGKSISGRGTTIRGSMSPRSTTGSTSGMTGTGESSYLRVGAN